MKKEPIPFITIVEGTGGSQAKSPYSFTLNPKAIEVFNSDILKNKKLSVVAIAGPQRTGKSFLANRLLKRMDGFAIGPSTIPCTKGIWIWGEPIRVSQDTYMIIIDTEGLNSVQRDLTIDIKIFSISILLSSVFIYNSIGHIDEKALENMSLVLNLSNSICLRKNQQGEEAAEDLGKFFPYFYWVLRDFSLDLKGKSEKEYLEECLAPISSNEKDPKNQIRGKIRKFFPYRSCECFPRPLSDEHKLAHIEEQQFEDLRPVFVERTRNFQKKFFNNLPVKLVNGRPITAEMFIGLTMEYLNAINHGAIPEILTSLERVVSTESRKVVEALQLGYQQAMADFLKDKDLPLDEMELEIKHKSYMAAINDRLEDKLKGLLDPQKFSEVSKQLTESLEKEYAAKLRYNSEKSQAKCKELLNLFFNNFKSPQIESVDSLTASLVHEKLEEYRKGIRDYFDKTKAPRKAQQNLQLTDTLAKLKTQLSSKKNQITTLKGKVAQLERNGGSTRESEDLASDVFTYVADLKHKLAEMDEFYKKKLLEVNPQERRCKQIDEIRNQKLLAIQRQREEGRRRKEEARRQIEKMKDGYDRNMEVLGKQLDSLRAQNLDYQQRLAGNPANEQKLKALILEKRKLEEALSLKQNNINIQNNLNTQKDKEINRLTGMRDELESKVAILSSQKANMESFRDSFGHVMREALACVLSKKNKLSQAVKTLGQEEIDSMRQAFKDNGLNPPF